MQALHAENAKRLDELNDVKRTTLSEQLATKASIVSSTQAENQSALTKEAQSVQKWGGFLAVLAIISTFFTLFCLSFIEAYKAGILPQGQGVAPPPKRKTKNRLLQQLKQFWQATQQPQNGWNSSVATQQSKTATQLVTQGTQRAPQVRTVHLQTDVSRLKNNIRTYYPRVFKTTSKPATRQNNWEKVQAWMAELEEWGIATHLDSDTQTVSFERYAKAQ